MSQFALCVGINRFENLPVNRWLNGCVNDTADVSALLGAMTEALDRAATPGEHLNHIVFTMSSHGTQLPDTSGDAADQVDEAFATYDLQQNGAV
ncbi:caspase family protein [Cryobacterium serini]|uniref:Caspase family protein n=1 Tax=Cryobacterium serini TaxID=1259201 RepID=A0A4R9BI33_9MICO|nr:caspase family protein [Cryobacterium serini]TFD84934.1 hypothetical protein E3T51_16470 [Cryobacterium serini]